MKFENNILNSDTKITNIEEEYAFTALVLLKPFRSINDLKYNSSFVEQYRICYDAFIKSNKDILQNIQNIHNANIFDPVLDSLEKETECYVPEKSQEMQENEKEEEELNNNFDEYMLNSLLNISGNVDSDMNNMMIENNNENDMEEISNSLIINLGIYFINFTFKIRK